jgi:hypothetical protein
MLDILTKTYDILDESVKLRVNTMVDYIFDQESLYGYIVYVPSSRRRRLSAEEEAAQPELHTDVSVCGSAGACSCGRAPPNRLCARSSMVVVAPLLGLSLRYIRRLTPSSYVQGPSIVDWV